MNLLYFLAIFLSGCFSSRASVKHPLQTQDTTIYNDTLNLKKDSSLETNSEMLPTDERIHPKKKIKIKPTPEPKVEKFKIEEKHKVQEQFIIPKKSDKNGQLVYSIEDTMKLGINYNVVVRILNGKSDEIGLGLDKSNLQDIKTSSNMEVEMVDPDKAFNITANNSQTQIVDSLEYTEWTFIVKPILAGSHPLTITSSIIQENGKKEKTYSQVIYVKNDVIVTAKGFWQTYWQWVFSTIIIPLSIWLYNQNKKSKNAS